MYSFLGIIFVTAGVLTDPNMGTYEARELARKELSEHEREQLVARLDSLALLIPRGEFKQNYEAYAELHSLKPDHPKYEDKMNYYKEQFEMSKYRYQRNEAEGVVVYRFGKEGPRLEISDYLVSVSSANRILRYLGLPQVATPGKNVEHFWYSGGRIGSGRLYRTDYRWTDYNGAVLTFERRSYGCGSGAATYDCLKEVRIEAQ